MTNEDIIANALIFFIAGFDTVAIVLSFFAYELALNTDVQQKLQQEIDASYAKGGGKISYESLQRMKYLDMVMSGRYFIYARFSTFLCYLMFLIHMYIGR